MKHFIRFNPIVAGDIVKVAAWLLALLVTAGLVSADNEAEINALIVSLAPVAAMLFNAAIAWLQREYVTPWQVDNPLVNYTAPPVVVDGEPIEE
jgi:hypothetical protein